ncbi:4-hydroxythreonine-4-phosphate dehydrogenase [Burkholderia sp. Ac-20379]|uniref:4-hydroxythreonine-4-phosphate dehydrogenase n=1 Tax=Burkholderia sp. Ac-20379 TaxID=2703900 RepID=UPI0019819295|nr:4-hydroxythreonine-4-phosphate dehydrogenase [Burkholderia sp. Ac-20379]MBN3724774.1 4-hydroxythreonine-4-phosphate dehydrogenase [Burkholderia sp. Ac-20379]
MSSHFILMLTENDATVPDALAVYDSLRDSPVRYVGFKDVGLPVAALKQLAQRIRADDRKVMLEVVATSRDSELESIQAALDIGVDYLLGGRHVEDALAMLNGSPIRYFPFAGRTVGHPTVLEGSMDEIVDDARRIAAMPGVHGLDLLAYRFTGEGDPAELTRRVTDAVRIPVIAAGSIDSEARVKAMIDARSWGFTVGSALFQGTFVKRLLPAQIDTIFKIEGVTV